MAIHSASFAIEQVAFRNIEQCENCEDQRPLLLEPPLESKEPYFE
jgi:hypothetical protein